MSALEEMLRELVFSTVRAENELIEAACERMLVTPERVGVVVLQYTDGISVGLSGNVDPMAISTFQMGVPMPTRGPE